MWPQLSRSLLTRRLMSWSRSSQLCSLLTAYIGLSSWPLCTKGIRRTRNGSMLTLPYTCKHYTMRHANDLWFIPKSNSLTDSEVTYFGKIGNTQARQTTESTAINHFYRLRSLIPKLTTQLFIQPSTTQGDLLRNLSWTTGHLPNTCWDTRWEVSTSLYGSQCQGASTYYLRLYVLWSNPFWDTAGVGQAVSTT